MDGHNGQNTQGGASIQEFVRSVGDKLVYTSVEQKIYNINPILALKEVG
jgi:hypothetical protein